MITIALSFIGAVALVWKYRMPKDDTKGLKRIYLAQESKDRALAEID